jgi:hypothetical protein
MEYKGNYWLTNSQMVRYQSMLCENPCIWMEFVKFHPATLLLVDSGLLEHDYFEVFGWVFFSWPDLTNQLIGHLDIEYFTDAASLSWMVHILLGMWWWLWTQSLGPACCWLELLQKRLNLLPPCRHSSLLQDSKCAFTTIHVHGALYKTEVTH